MIADPRRSSELAFKLTPQVSIKATNELGQPILTTISLTDAKYVNGVFAKTSAQAQVIESNATTAAVPFQLPGTRIEIIPVGLYFFSAYLLVFLTILGWGTFERAKFRDQYRKRVATSGYR